MSFVARCCSRAALLCLLACLLPAALSVAAGLQPVRAAGQPDRVGVYNGGQWILDIDGDGLFNAGPDLAFFLGFPGAQIVVGDWDGDGRESAGVFAGGFWYLDFDGDGVYNPAGADKQYPFGWAGTSPVIGDWNGDGATDVGVFYQGSWFLDFNGNRLWDGTPADRAFSFGWAGAAPHVGDWNGDGKSKVGFFANGAWFLDYDGNQVWDGGVADRAISLGWTGATMLVGDWDGDGRDQVGVFSGGFWFLDYNGNGVWDGGAGDKQFPFGWNGVTPVTGDWNGDGKIQVGAFHQGNWFLDQNGNALWDGGAGDATVGFGQAGNTPVPGRWGPRASTPGGPGLVDPPNGQAGVPTNRRIVLRLPAAVNPSTVTSATVQLKRGSAIVAATRVVSADGRFVSIRPAAPLPASASYTLLVNGLKSPSGADLLPAPLTSTFQTGASADSTPLFGAAGTLFAIPLNASFYMELSANVDPTTFDPAAWAVRETASGTVMPLNCTLSSAWDSVSCDVTQPLWAGAMHELIGSELESLSGIVRGNAASPYFSFNAGFTADNTPPQLLGVSPPEGYTGFPYSAEVRLVFSERVNTIGPQTKIAIECEGAPVPALIRQSPPDQGPHLRLSPPQGLPLGKACQVIVQNVRDMAGRTFPGPFVSSFTTNSSGGVFSSVHYFPDGSGSLPLNAALRTTFSSAVVASTVTSGTVKLTGPTGVVPASISLSAPNQVTLTPLAPLSPFASYKLQIGPGLLNVDGFSHFHVMDYATGAAVDQTPPSVVTLSPPNGAAGVPPNAIVHVELSEPLDPASVTPQTARLLPSNSPLELAGNRLLRLPSGVAISGSAIDLNGLRDWAGNVMPRFTSSFQLAGGVADSQGPLLQSSTPARGAANVPVSQVITLRFNEGVSPQSVDSSSVQLLVRRDGVFTHVPAAVNAVGANVEIRAVPSLLPNSEYQVDVGRQQGGAAFGPADYAGNRTPAFEAFTFTTGAGPLDVTPPQVTSITPLDGSVSQELLNSNTRIAVKIGFSEAIDPSTLTAGGLLFLSNGLPGGVSSIEVAEDLRGVEFLVTGPGGMEAGLMTVIASREITDIAGNPLAADFFSRFTVQSSGGLTSSDFAIHETRPADHATAIPAGTKISILTNLPFFPGNLNQAFHVVANGQPVSGLFQSRAGDRIVQFTPSQSLPAGATVQITPKPEFSAAGNRAPILNALFPVTFRVKPADAALPPHLVGVSPNVPRDITRTPMGNTANSRILARFSEPLDPAGVNSGSVRLVGPWPAEQAVPGTAVVTPDGDTIEFLPAQPLANGTRYDLSIDASIRDLQGQSPAQAVLYSFAIVDTADANPPLIHAVSPPNAFQGAPVNSLIKVRFTEAVNPLTVRDTTIRLLRIGQPVLGLFKISADLELVTLTPLEYLAPNAAYSVQLNGVQDAAGNAVAPTTWTFVTSAVADAVRPDRQSALPQGTGSGVNSKLILRFDEAIDQTGIPVNFVKDEIFHPVPGSLAFSTDGKVIQFTPDAPFQPNTLYRSVFNDGDLAGNPGGDGQHNFTTGGGVDLTPPAVTLADPPNGSTNVSPFVTISVEMNEYIDPVSVNPQNVQVLDGALQVPVAASMHYDLRTIKIQALSGLPLGRELTVRIANVADVSGNSMAAPLQFSFSTRGALDFTGPSYWSNAKGSLGLPRDVAITIAFTEPLDPASVSPSTIYFAANLVPLPSQPVLDSSGRFVRLSPSGALPAAGWFQVVVNGATDLNGNPARAAAPTQDYFGTGAALTDAAPPSILRFQPLGGATNVPLNVIVDAEPSEPLDPFSFTGEFLEVRDPNGALVLARRPLQFHPPLAPNTTYTIRTKAAADYAGKPLAAQTSTFTTSAGALDNTAPQITSQFPASQASGVPVDVVLVVDFSEPVIASNILLRFTNPFRDIPTTWTLSNNSQRLTIQPLEILAPNSYHSAYMTIFDLAGNGLNNPQGYHAFGFTTAAAAPLSEEGPARLRVLHVNPPDGASDIAGGSVALTLSEPLAPASLGDVFLNGAASGASLTQDGRTLEWSLLSVPGPQEADVAVSTRALALSGAAAAPFSSRLGLAAPGASRAYLASVRPPAGAIGVAPDAKIYLYFSAPLDPSSAPASVEVLATGAFVSGSTELTGGGRTIVFTPDLPFASGANALIRVKQSMLRTAAGSQLADWPHESFFEVEDRASAESVRFSGKPLDPSTPPAVSPPDGASRVPLDAVIVAVFDSPPDPSALPSLRLRDAAGPVACRLSVATAEGSIVATLTPHQPLRAGEPYVVSLGDGGPADKLLSTFSTEPPAPVPADR